MDTKQCGEKQLNERRNIDENQRTNLNTQQINKKEAMWGASQMLGKDSIIISSEW